MNLGALDDHDPQGHITISLIELEYKFQGNASNFEFMAYAIGMLSVVWMCSTGSGQEQCTVQCDEIIMQNF